MRGCCCARRIYIVLAAVLRSLSRPSFGVAFVTVLFGTALRVVFFAALFAFLFGAGRDCETCFMARFRRDLDRCDHSPHRPLDRLDIRGR
jgi:hypothetical protein